MTRCSRANYQCRWTAAASLSNSQERRYSSASRFMLYFFGLVATLAISCYFECDPKGGQAHTAEAFRRTPCGGRKWLVGGLSGTGTWSWDSELMTSHFYIIALDWIVILFCPLDLSDLTWLDPWFQGCRFGLPITQGISVCFLCSAQGTPWHLLRCSTIDPNSWDLAPGCRCWMPLWWTEEVEGQQIKIISEVNAQHEVHNFCRS